MTSADDFLRRRVEAHEAVNALDDAKAQSLEGRNNFFDAVYERADGDGAQVPWADLKPKPHLQQWLDGVEGSGKTALDIACGLGDNAEAMSDAGFEVTGFDISETAIDWARQRFPQTSVNYQVADLFSPPSDWTRAFDLVFECYTLQALPPDRFSETADAIGALVKPGGSLLVYTRLSMDDAPVDGPPWPLKIEQADVFANLGFALVTREEFKIRRPDKTIPHSFTHWIRKVKP